MKNSIIGAHVARSLTSRLQSCVGAFRRDWTVRLRQQRPVLPPSIENDSSSSIVATWSIDFLLLDPVGPHIRRAPAIQQALCASRVVSRSSQQQALARCSASQRLLQTSWAFADQAFGVPIQMQRIPDHHLRPLTCGLP